MKPQFEAGRAVVSKGKGVVRDPKIWASVLCDVAGAFEANGAGVVGGMASPLLGAEGNVEFFLHLRSGAKPPPSPAGRRQGPEELLAPGGPDHPGPDQPGPAHPGPAHPGLAGSPLSRSMDELALSVGLERAPDNPGRGKG